jgi:hypothetical protein
MVTLYHLDGKQLILTHYCSAGNQPTMRAIPGTPGGPIHFDYIGATGLHSVNDGHMHAMTFLQLAQDQLLTSWTFYENQEPAGDKVFKLVRATSDEPEEELAHEAAETDETEAAVPVEEASDLAALEAELDDLEAEIEADVATEEEAPKPDESGTPES